MKQFTAAHYAVFAVSLLAAFLYLLAMPTFQVGTYMDDALYITLGKSIASGQGFRRIELLGAPETTFVPFGYPLLLSWLIFLFPTTYLPLQLQSLAFAVGNLVLLWRWLSIRVSRWMAVLVLGLYALNGIVVGMATMVMSETAFIFFVLLALNLLDTYERQQRAASWTGLALSLAIATACMVRIVGVAFIAAVVIHYLLRHQIRKAIAIGLPVGIVLCGWFFRNQIVSGSLLSREYTEIAGRSSGVEGYLSQLTNTLAGYFFITPETLAPLFSPRIVIALGAVGPVLVLVFSILIWIVLIVGASVKLRRRVEAADLYVGITVAMLAAWGYQQGRYLMPLLPFLYLYLVLGAHAVARWLIPNGRPYFQPAYVTVLLSVAIMVMSLVRDIAGIRSPVRERIPDVSLGALWISEHTPTDAVVMTQTPRVTFIYANRTTVPYPPMSVSVTDVDAPYVYKNLYDTSPHEALLLAIRDLNVDYLLLAPPLETSAVKFVPELDEYLSEVVLPTVRKNSDLFQLVYDNPHAQVFVYRITQ